MIQRSQLRRGSFNGTRFMAGLALLFSFLAFLMAGVVMLRTGPEGGGLKANLRTFGDEAGKVFSDLRSRLAGGEGSKAGSGPGTPYGGESGPPSGDSPAAGTASSEDTWTSGAGSSRVSTTDGEADQGGESDIEIDAIKERVDEIKDKVLAEDKTAGDTIDELKKDLAELRDRTKNRGGPLLDEIAQALTDARKSLAEDSAEAARRLRELSDDLVRRSREQTRRLMADPTPGAEPGDSPADH